MKKSIRIGTFETNSSSTHSLTIVTKSEFERFKKGELIAERWNGCLHEKSKFSEDDCLDDFADYDNFGGDYEYFEKSFTTPSGEEVVAFGYFGYDS